MTASVFRRADNRRTTSVFPNFFRYLRSRLIYFAQITCNSLDFLRKWREVREDSSRLAPLCESMSDQRRTIRTTRGISFWLKPCKKLGRTLRISNSSACGGLRSNASPISTRYFIPSSTPFCSTIWRTPHCNPTISLQYVAPMVAARQHSSTGFCRH